MGKITVIDKESTGLNAISRLRSETPLPAADRQYRWITAVLFAISLLTLCFYAGLLTAGRWETDEFFDSALIERYGLKHFFWYRVTDWSPRPIGELLAGSYLALSNLLDRPLIGSCLAILWAIALAVAIGAAKLAKLSASVATALALFALSLLIAKPGEMFYWPMAATAYLPCWAAMLAVTLMLMGRGPILAVVLALVLMAWSFEAGAVAALVFCLGEIVLRSRGGREERNMAFFSRRPMCADGLLCQPHPSLRP